MKKSPRKQALLEENLKLMNGKIKMKVKLEMILRTMMIMKLKMMILNVLYLSLHKPSSPILAQCSISISPENFRKRNVF